ncbi:integrin alpha-E [Tachyglossus aculeatus]|uniref:integrin alpha-E n=1 Tax=Tachyglossus aculeatus TaxID=9261 RepID=UPI0018F4F3AC|nr:integrin alpha-E [Tachyglossus aculeatus]
MKLQGLFQCLLYLTTIISLRSFNIDINKMWITSSTHFVSEVLMHSEKSKKTCLLITSSPRNEVGSLFKCSIIQDKISCDSVSHVHDGRLQGNGLTLARNSEQILLCSQLKWRRPRSLTEELNGNCILFTADLQEKTSFNFSSIDNLVQETPDESHDNSNNNNNKNNNSFEQEMDEEERGTEIAIVLDGSGSISPEDFEKAKDFIFNIMTLFYKKCFECELAVVQYGSVIQTEFDLLASRDANSSLQKVKNIKQVKEVTKTASAINHVLKEIFNAEKGSRRQNSKIIIVLTDGDVFHDPMNLASVMNSPEMEGIERYAIGVGNEFNASKKTLDLIASEPHTSHIFRVENFSGLDGLLRGLEQKIISIEGTSGETALQFELAQISFSAQILDQKLILLGAVGAFDWSGGVLLYNVESKKWNFMNESKKEAKTAQYSYLGYSVAVMQKSFGSLFIVGAPRHSHTGKVLALRSGSSTSLWPVLKGEQMGSYFGSTLCPLDLQQDGKTDYLLVGAPFYHIQGEEGRVYVYRFNEKEDNFTLSATLNKQPQFPLARFGFAVAGIGDVNQDGFGDVAIGAPLEGFLGGEMSFGSVYIYNGYEGGILDSPSQRIEADKISTGLQYFGMSIDGGLDLTEDGLVDIAVLSLNNATVLRSRPVVHMNVSMTFTPAALPIDFNNTIEAVLCFESNSALPASWRDLENDLSITIELDVKKQEKRIQFGDKNTKLNLTREWKGQTAACEDLQLFVLPCNYHCFSNIGINVSYQFSRPDYGPILDRYRKPTAYFQLPYEKDCKDKLKCIPELSLSTNLSTHNLVVGHTENLNMTINLTNSGEDSFRTNFVLSYPRNLLIKKIQELSSPTQNVQCSDPKQVTSLLAITCKISHPRFRNSSKRFLVTWQVDKSKFPNRTAEITVNVNNNEDRRVVENSHLLQFQHAFIAVLIKQPVLYMNISQGLSEHKKFEFKIHGENHFEVEFQLQICVPVKVQGHEIVHVKNITSTQNDTKCRLGDIGDCHGAPGQECQLASCSILASKGTVTMMVTVDAELSFRGSEQLTKFINELRISGKITFDENLYQPLKAENHEAEVTLILLKIKEFNFLPVILSSSIGGILVLILIIILLIKCGFFKRKYQVSSQRADEQENFESLVKKED